MARKWKMIMSGMAVTIMLAVAVHTAGNDWVYVSAVEWTETEGNENPATGEHPSPLIAGMALAFSGVALCILVDENSRKK